MIRALAVVLLTLGSAVLSVIVWCQLDIKRIERKMERYRRRVEEIDTMTVEEARQELEPLLTDAGKFMCVSTQEPPGSSVNFLAPNLRSLLVRFESVRADDKRAFISRRLIAPYRWDEQDGPWRQSRFWQVGTLSGQCDAVVLVKEGQEALYFYYENGTCFDNPETPEIERAKELEPSDSSIYHWLLTHAID